jgi:predicted nucleic acid-binding protein
VKIILDTGPLVALINRRDSRHDWASGVLEQCKPPLWTCEAVLAEAAHLSGRPFEIMAQVEVGSLRIGMEIEENAAHLQRLLSRYAGRMDLADACVVRMTEIFTDCRVLTLDREDFSIYRRHGRAVIPFIAPED